VNIKNIRNQIKKLPKKPGVYFFRNQNKKIIYIGKALSLKSRVSSYFNQSPKPPRIEKLVSQIVSLDHLIVNSELEALVLEAKLIKEHQPEYNIQHKDGKRYLYIAIFKTPLPHINIVRRPDLQKNIYDWFGPFPSGAAAKQVFRLLRRIFPFCSCSTLPSKKCFYRHLGLCPGKESLASKTHWENISRVRKFLSGKTTLVVRQLAKRMNSAAEKQDYEEAQKYKKQIEAITTVTQGWRSIPTESQPLAKTLQSLKKMIVKYQKIDPTTLTKIEGYDVSNLGKNIVVGAMVAFSNGRPDKSSYRKFKINYKGVFPEERLTMKSQNDPGSIYQTVKRRLNHPEWIYPQLILVDGGKAQVSAAFKALKEKQLEEQIALLGLAKREETIVVPEITNKRIKKFNLVKRSPRSPVLKLLQRVRDESHRFAQRYYKKLHQKVLLQT